jgi:outer membrane immunogenic protein
MKNLIAAVAAVVALAGSAFAADMPLKAPPPPPPPAFTWTGVYGGGFIGGMWTHTDNSFVFPPIATFDQSSSQGVGGGMVGIQYQFNNFVLGAEGGVGFGLGTGLGSAACNPPAACAPGTVITGTLTDALWTVGGRGGWAIGRWLPYVAGGYANASFRQSLFFPGATEFGEAAHDGAYLGGGIDWAVYGPWVMGFEYRHYWFDTQQTVPSNVAFNTYSSRPTIDTAVFRLSYLFNVMGR